MSKAWNRVNLNTEDLINSVKKRPSLYNTDDPMYYNNKKRHKALHWMDVCKEIIPNFEQMKAHQRVECVHEIQKRWKSLRTCFGRELLLQRKEALKREKNIPVRRRRVYGYFNDLKFLLPNCKTHSDQTLELSDNETNDNDEMDNNDNNAKDDDDEDDPLDSIIKAESPFDNPRTVNTLLIEPESYNNIYENNHKDGKVMTFYTSTSKNEQNEHDEDKQFLMSLVPSFRKLNDRQKFEARIEILKVLKDITFKNDSGSSS